MNVIEIVDLKKSYRGKKRTLVEALKGVDLKISPGEVFGFLGPNGAGKSTTIKAMMGQIKPSSGAVNLFGVAATETTARKRVGYLPENPSFYDFLTAREYLKVVGDTHAMDKSVTRNESQRVLALLDLNDAADRPIKGYSKGMVQRLGVAQTLLHDPDLYILDEPMSGLDPLGRALIKKIIRELKQAGKTVFFSTHITNDIEALCDRIGIIVNGKLCALESVADLMASGLEGYVVHYTDRDGHRHSQQVASNLLREQLELHLSTGTTLEGVEPCRRDLEAYFLEIVERGHAAS